MTDIQKIIFHLKERGIGVLVTDHNVRETLRITDRAYIVHDGAIFRSGTPDSLAADEEVRRIYLGADFRLGLSMVFGAMEPTTDRLTTWRFRRNCTPSSSRS